MGGWNAVRLDTRATMAPSRDGSGMHPPPADAIRSDVFNSNRCCRTPYWRRKELLGTIFLAQDVCVIALSSWITSKAPSISFAGYGRVSPALCYDPYRFGGYLLSLPDRRSSSGPVVTRPCLDTLSSSPRLLNEPTVFGITYLAYSSFAFFFLLLFILLTDTLVPSTSIGS